MDDAFLLTSLPLNNTEEFKSIFSEPHPDARIQIILNTADSVWIDNLRFAGKLKENTVNKYEPVTNPVVD